MSKKNFILTNNKIEKKLAHLSQKKKFEYHKHFTNSKNTTNRLVNYIFIFSFSNLTKNYSKKNLCQNKLFFCWNFEFFYFRWYRSSGRKTDIEKNIWGRLFLFRSKSIKPFFQVGAKFLIKKILIFFCLSKNANKKRKKKLR